ncbi:gtpase-activator protein for ras-like gtpase [Gigaspora margarita]|uniref:Gtpase-activator protein for ras-like gtpase n=1 Tax=Gigaspora margarita TaxID=4874 RepID=A0A8H3XFU1_GIGMA|nr:gtpase-activator protein for ras-like gtpase [Gigaspora margarita]
MNGDIKLILSLIGKISRKLPCNSGKKLEILEQDPLILQTVNAIVELSRYKLGTIANNLTQLLETVSQSTTTISDISSDVLQSQLFILKILSACTTHHWKFYRRTLQKELESLPRTSSDNDISPTSPTSHHEIPPLNNDQQPTPIIPNLNGNSKNFKPPKSWDDPPQLEEALATYILNVLSRFLHLMANQDDGIPSGGVMGAGAGRSDTSEIISEIYKNAGRVIFYISASNWNVVFSRIKNRIAHLAAASDNWSETAELKLLEVSDLNSKRLSMSKLFNPAKPFPNEMNVDHRLMTDCLTALFRLNPRKTQESLIPSCLQDNAPSAFKLVLVKSCNSIASEENRLPWNLQISSMRSMLAAPLRKLFHDIMSNGDRPAWRRDRTEILLNLLRLYRTDPKLAIVGKESRDQSKDNQSIILAINNCLNEPNISIRTAAAETLLEFHNVELIDLWGSQDNKMQQFWHISSQITLSIANLILHSKERDTVAKDMLDLLSQLLVRRNEFLKAPTDRPLKENNVSIRHTSNIKLESALLIMLCSPDPDICLTAVNCFGQLCLEAELTSENLANDMEAPPEFPPSQMTIVDNMTVYKELSTIPYPVPGRMAQQRRIRKLLRSMTQPNAGNLGAWEEAFTRWQRLTQLIVRAVQEQHPDQLQQAQLTEWLNYTGFLSALGGCCVHERLRNITPRFGDFSRRTSTSPNDYHAMAEKYVHEMVGLLVSDSNFVRENVKDILGSELSPRLYVILFQNLDEIVSSFFDGDGQANPNDRCTVFVEQAILVLKLTLERIYDLSENLYACDVGNLVLSFAKYLNRLSANQVSLRIKKRMCLLVELLMEKKDYVSLRLEIKLRNKLLEIIIEWTSDYNVKPDAQNGTEPSMSGGGARNERMHRDLDQACLKTIVSLLHQLPLQPSDSIHDVDLSQVRSRLFQKYFNFFIKLLNRCRILEAIDSGTHSAKNNEDLQMLLSKSKEYVKDLGPLKDYTILALSKLLSANVDSGLRYSISMAYHEDTKTRTAFVQVLTNILNQGAEFEGLGENAVKDRYERLVEMVTNSFEVALSLCEACPQGDADELARVLTAVFDSKNKMIPFLNFLIDREVHNNSHEEEIFRSNSFAQKLLCAFAKVHGCEFLRETLQPPINDLLSKPDDFDCDLNPGRYTTAEIERNKINLKATIEIFLDAIYSSTMMPNSFRHMCYHIARIVEMKYPLKKYTAVGAFIFLRFFNPAIASPDSENLCKPIENARTRRALLSVTRVIQTIANNGGRKESHMNDLNDFITANVARMNAYLERISQLPISTPTSELSTIDTPPRRLDDADRKMLHKFLHDNLERMYKELQNRRSKSLGQPNDESAQANKATLDRIATLLAQLGPPMETQKKEFFSVNVQSSAPNNLFFLEFMKKNSHRGTEMISGKKIFYEGGLSLQRRPVFYYIARRLDAEATDIELLIYYALHTIEAHMTRQFEILIDLTKFGPSNEIQLQWVQQFVQVFPYDAIENLSAIYLYNPNSAFKKFAKKLAKPLSPGHVKKVHFCCSLNELSQYIAHNEMRLPRSTTQLDTDSSVTYSNVNRVSHYRSQVPVTMKISNEHVQVLTLRRQELFNGLSSTLNDVYQISEIEDVSNSSRKNNEGEFIIKHDRGRPAIAFTSPRKDLIMQAIRTSKARYQIVKPTTMTESVLRPNGVPGTLLNMALLNIGSDDPNLRLAAYDLLVALSLNFNFDVGNQLLSAKGLCIPANNTTFVQQLSERLAITETHLTLEFLTEVFVGFSKSNPSQKHLCLQYMAPWLANLAFYGKNGSETQNSVADTKLILHKLIDLTVRETEMYTAVQSNIWHILKGVDEITNLIIDTFVEYAVKVGIGTTQAEIVANTMVTLSSVNVRGKIIARLRNTIAKTSQDHTRNLTDNPAWTEIAVLIRFNLMLSFSNRVYVQLYLPELFHIISILIATGPPLIRASVHGLIVNLVQSLCTAQPLAPDNYRRLTLLLTELSEPNFKFFFGLNHSPGNAFLISAESTRDMPDTMPLSSLETVIQALLEVIICGAPSIDISNAWRARWMGLVASTAFQNNPAIQPRAFVALGCLAREEVDDDLLYQILVALKKALNSFSENDCSLIISIIMCLTKIVENLDPESRYLQYMFWLAMSLIQIGHIPIFPSAVNFLQVVLRSYDMNNFFATEDISTVLLRTRDRLASVSAEMDMEAGINYEHFSFAVAAALLKGLKNPTTKSSTQAVLTTFLDISSKGIDPDLNLIHFSMLGYLAALLPLSAKNGDMKELLWLCGIFDMDIDNSELSTTYFPIFTKLDIPDNRTALLLVSLMVTMLQNAEHEPERLFLYGFLAEAATMVPEVFSLFFDALQPKMIQIVTNSDTIAILDSVQSILLAVASVPQLARPQDNHISYLEEVRFNHLMDCGSFQSVTRDKMKNYARLASELVECIIRP